MFDWQNADEEPEAALDVILSSRSTRLDLATVAEQLKMADHRNLLNGRQTHLAVVLAAASAFAGENVRFFEFGACQYNLDFRLDALHPGICQHMSLTDPHRYRAFDSRYRHELVRRNAGEILNNTDRLGRFPQGRRALEELARAIPEVSIENYDEVERRVRDAQRQGAVPVVFSVHVFNEMARERGHPFWNLPGLHVHQCWLGEVSAVLNLYRDELREYAHNHPEVACSSDEYWDIGIVAQLARNSLGSDHLRRFSSKVELEHIGIERIGYNVRSNGKVITYIWPLESREGRLQYSTPRRASTPCS